MRPKGPAVFLSERQHQRVMEGCHCIGRCTIDPQQVWLSGMRAIAEVLKFQSKWRESASDLTEPLNSLANRKFLPRRNQSQVHIARSDQPCACLFQFGDMA